MECIGKGKARKPYEFGVKASIAVSHQSGLIVGARTFAGNPYDGHRRHVLCGGGQSGMPVSKAEMHRMIASFAFYAMISDQFMLKTGFIQAQTALLSVANIILSVKDNVQNSARPLIARQSILPSETMQP